MIVVACHGQEPEESIIYGPFIDKILANVWITQHNHDLYEDDPNFTLETARMEDYNHWCINGSIHHEVIDVDEPAFDPREPLGDEK